MDANKLLFRVEIVPQSIAEAARKKRRAKTAKRGQERESLQNSTARKETVSLQGSREIRHKFGGATAGFLDLDNSRRCIKVEGNDSVGQRGPQRAKLTSKKPKQGGL